MYKFYYLFKKTKMKALGISQRKDMVIISLMTICTQHDKISSS